MLAVVNICVVFPSSYFPNKPLNCHVLRAQMFLTSLSDPARLDVYEFKKNPLIYRYTITASGEKTVMKLSSMRRDEGIPPLKVMASLLGLQ